MAIAFLPKNKEKNETKNQAVDWWGIGFLIMAVGSLQTVLEQGETEDWFSSRFIVNLVIIGIIGLGLFIWRELKTDHPAVNLRVLRHRSLAAEAFFQQ